MTDLTNPTPDEVEHHGPVEPGIYHIDVESLFGHITDPEHRQLQAQEYAYELKEKLPEGSIVLPMDVEYLGHVDDADRLITRDGLREEIQDAMEETREQALEDFTDYLKSAKSPE